MTQTELKNVCRDVQQRIAGKLPRGRKAHVGSWSGEPRGHFPVVEIVISRREAPVAEIIGPTRRENACWSYVVVLHVDEVERHLSDVIDLGAAQEWQGGTTITQAAAIAVGRPDLAGVGNGPVLSPE